MKNNKAITLIALVITIIVLLILAGITIAQLSNSGLFDKAKLAKEKYQNAQNDEDDKIAKYSNEIDSYVDGNRGTVTLTDEEYQIFKNQTTVSTDEKIIGTYVNNKPIYKKLFVYTFTNNNCWYVLENDFKANYHIDEIVTWDGNIIRNTTGEFFPIALINNGNGYPISANVVIGSNDKLYFDNRDNTSYFSGNFTIKLILQYTKTTA